MESDLAVELPERAISQGACRWTAVMAMAFAGGALLFQQSPANEVLRTHAALDVLKATESALAVGAAVAGITVIIEFVSAALITFGLHARNESVQRMKARLIKRATSKTAPESVEQDSSAGARAGRISSDIAVALGLGAGLVTLRRHVATSDPTIRSDLTVSAYATAIVASVSGLIGFLVGGGLAHAEQVGLGVPAGYIVDYGTDTRFWMGLLIAGYAVVLVTRWARGRKQ